jgi:hypothetical protein
MAGLFQYGTAQNTGINPELLSNLWQAKWITVAGAPANEYGVYHFRKIFDLSAKPGKFVIHVSADNRYKLFINGELVSLGPARSDIYNWSFETVDIAPQLHVGKNTIAAVVWNFAQYAPVAQMSFRQTGFIVQGNSGDEQIVNTDQTWKGIKNESYSPVNTNLNTYFVVGPGDRVDAAKYTWGWEQQGFDDSSWSAVRQIISGGGKGSRDYPGWQLTPCSIPAQELTNERIPKLRKAEGISLPADFPEKAGNYTIPASSQISLLIDQTHLTTAYLNLLFSKGKGAEITVKYAESLYNKGQRSNDKGNRDQIDGKFFVGYEDQIVSDGGDHRCFTSLWWRTYRYIQIEIKTASEPLVLHDIYGIYTGYPFQLASKFNAPEMPELDKILDVGWRTARLCAHETYMDCPYYEQLQYFGDTRIQAMVTLYNTRDDRLVRNAINNGRQSIIADGITMSRYPTNLHQFIPSFSIWWIGIIYDYWMHRGDSAFVVEQLPYTRMIMDYYERHLRDDASLSYINYWFFTDWSFKNGEPPRMPDGQSSIQDLHFITGLQLAGAMERKLGMPAFADKYEQIIARMKAGFKAKYWDESRKLFADTPEKTSFSQHANILSILTNMVEGQEATDLMARILQEKDLTPATIYFSYYLNRAMDKTGMGNSYLNTLDIWRAQLANGLTTWAETSDPYPRSDCHAWGASPNVELYRIVLGIHSSEPGFKKVLITPNLGRLHNASGCIPHPNGDICVNYQVDAKGNLKTEITLPNGITGTFVWNGKKAELHGGKQILEMKL